MKKSKTNKLHLGSKRLRTTAMLFHTGILRSQSSKRDLFPDRAKKLKPLIGVLLIGIAIIGSAVFLSQSRAATTTYRIMPLGDSITDGFPTTGGCNSGDSTRVNQGGYRIELGKKLQAAGIQFVYVAQLTNGPLDMIGGRKHSGYCGAWIGGAKPAAGGNDIYSKIYSLIATHSPDIILLQIGTNDLLHAGGTPQEAATRLGVLIDKITTQAPNTRVIVSTLTPMSSTNTANFNSYVPGLVAVRKNAGKLVYLNDNAAAGMSFPNDFHDHVHPNFNGYAKMANKWLESIKTSLGTSTPGDTTPPSTPANVAASPAVTAANLSWTASTDNVAVTGYEVQYKLATATAWTSAGLSTGITRTINGLTAGQQYNFQVRARDGAGNNSAWSSVASATPESSPPIAQPDLVITSLTPTTATAGQPISFQATIKNQGTAATPAGTIHGVAFRVDGTLVNWNDVHTTSLAPGASVTLTATGGPSSTATWTPPATGTVTVEAYVDDINRIPGELDETNNKLTTTVTVTATTTTKPGDANGDGVVNGLDLSTVLTNYGKTGQTRAQGDANGDGVVNGLDLSVVLSNYGG